MLSTFIFYWRILVYLSDRRLALVTSTQSDPERLDKHQHKHTVKREFARILKCSPLPKSFAPTWQNLCQHHTPKSVYTKLTENTFCGAALSDFWTLGCMHQCLRSFLNCPQWSSESSLTDRDSIRLPPIWLVRMLSLSYTDLRNQRTSLGCAGHLCDLSVLSMGIQNLVTILKNLCVTEITSVFADSIILWITL